MIEIINAIHACKTMEELDAEKDVVEKALRMLFDDWELGKIKEQTYMPVEEQPCI